jgi:hypothetical protein
LEADDMSDLLASKERIITAQQLEAALYKLQIDAEVVETAHSLARRIFDAVPAPETKAESQVRVLRAALERILKWQGEFPPTGRTWDDGTPMSYAACYGSNGERDFMRGIALEALDATERPAPETQCFGCAQGWHRQSDYPNASNHVHCPPRFIQCTAVKAECSGMSINKAEQS